MTAAAAGALWTGIAMAGALCDAEVSGLWRRRGRVYSNGVTMHKRRTDLSLTGFPEARRSVFTRLLEALTPRSDRPGGPHDTREQVPLLVDAPGTATGDAEQVVALLDRQRVLEERLARHHVELAAVTKLLQKSELSEAQFKDRAEWLTIVSMVLLNKPAWWSLLPPPFQRRAVHRRLRRKNLFDAATYLAEYPDVQAAKADPLGHYIRHGVQENRIMGFTTPPGGWGKPRS